MDTIKSVVGIINGITRIVLALVPLGIVLGVVFGQVDFFSGVVGNLINIVKMFAAEGLIWLMAIAIVIWLFNLAGIFTSTRQEEPTITINTADLSFNDDDSGRTVV